MESEGIQKLVEVLEWFMPVREFANLKGLPWQDFLLQSTWLGIKNAFFYGAVGWLIAWLWERRGLRKLAEREADVADVRVDADDSAVRGRDAEKMDSRLIDGSIVLSHDFFRGLTIFVARIFGGRIRFYERLYDRARREAIVRLKETARGEGYDHIVNLKLLPAAIKRNGPATVEVLAYGTGVRFKN